MYKRLVKGKEEVCYYRSCYIEREDLVITEGFTAKCMKIGRLMNEDKFCVGCEGFKAIERGRIENKGW